MLETKFLGLLVDDQITWASHINLINNSLKQFMGILFKRRHSLKANCKKMLFYAMIYPKLTYAIELYGMARMGLLDTLKVAVNRILKL